MLDQNVCLAAFAAGDDLRDVAKKFDTDFTWSVIYFGELGIVIVAKLGGMTSRYLNLTQNTTSDKIAAFLHGIVSDYERNVDDATTARINELTEELHKLRELQARRAAR